MNEIKDDLVDKFYDPSYIGQNYRGVIFWKIYTPCPNSTVTDGAISSSVQPFSGVRERHFYASDYPTEIRVSPQ